MNDDLDDEDESQNNGPNPNILRQSIGELGRPSPIDTMIRG